MTRTVTTVQADDVPGLVDAAREAGGDLVEVRLDALAEVTPDVPARVVEAVDRPLLVTLRSAKEGGGLEVDGDRREAILRAAIAAGPAWIDLETRDRDLVDAARREDVRTVVSRHHERPVDSGTLLADLERQQAMGATVAKVAMPTDGPDDVLALLDAAEQARRRGWSYALMGVDDPVLRALAPTLDMALVYTAPGAGTAAASGQLPTELMTRLAALQARRDPLRIAGLLGRRVRRSLSPPMHNTAFEAVGVPATYVPLDVDPEDLSRVIQALRSLPFFGFNVTIPYKEIVVDHLDRLDASAEKVGAVNTVRIEAGRMIGHNTDVTGVRAALEEVDVPEGPALVVGAGGAARACVVALEGDRTIRVANRTPERAEAVVEDLGGEAFSLEPDALEAAARGAALLVNATPISPDVPVEALAPDAVVADLAYRPRVTELLERAQATGRRIVTGDRVLLHQAADAFELWTRHDAPRPIMEQALEAAYDG